MIFSTVLERWLPTSYVYSNSLLGTSHGAMPMPLGSDGRDAMVPYMPCHAHAHGSLVYCIKFKF